MAQAGPRSQQHDSPEATAVRAPDALGYRRPLPDLSTNGGESSANDRPASGFSAAGKLRRDMAHPSGAGPRRLPDLRIAIQSILGFWLLYVALITLRALVLQYPDFWPMMARRSVATAAGAAITFFVYLAMRPLAQASLAKNATIAALLCLPASILFASFNYYIFYIYAPLDQSWRSNPMWANMSALEMAVKSIAEGALSWYFLFAAWAALYVAMSVARRLRAADRRAAMLEREAQDAQLRALRYQINPHFLFNTLNSLSSLVLSERNETAEQMIMNLSNFFRSTLSADPTADVPLSEEIALQRLYLDIEQIRFPERLKIELDVPADLLPARVPVLLLQPVVENAVKYGVARSRGAVTIRIAAREEAGKLHLEVSDDGEAKYDEAALESAGTGVGLRNVCDRLVARYGVQAGCFHGPGPAGGYNVQIVLPMVRHG